MNNSHLEESFIGMTKKIMMSSIIERSDRRLFLGRLRYPKNKSNLSFNNSLNNNEINYINYKGH